jgi:hypothetical protein
MENKDFVEYPEALALKELGFDEPCLGYYNTTRSKQNELLFPQYAGELENWNEMTHLCSAPLYQQAFRFFREKHGIGSWIHHYFDMDKGTFIYSYVLTLPHRGEEYVYDTHEEAELECLKKLIEIVKNGK